MDKTIREIENSIIRAAWQAIEINDTKALLWTIKHGVELGERMCEIAADYGNLEALQILRENGCPWRSVVFSYVFPSGHFNIIKYAIENNCPREGITTHHLSDNGHFEALKYTVENGIPWSKHCLQNLVLQQDFDMVTWAIDNGCPCYEQDWKDNCEEGEMDSEIIERVHELIYTKRKRCLIGTPDDCCFCRKLASWNIWSEHMKENNYLQWFPEEVLEDILKF